MPVLHDLDTPVDYARRDYKGREHFRRYLAYVKANGLTCQECGGSGSIVDDVIDGYRIRFDCGWCEGTGKVTRHLRGQWLRDKRKLTPKQLSNLPHFSLDN
jgi:hypothetical protein